MQEKNPYKTNFPPTPFVQDKCNDWLLSLHSAFMDVPEEENSSGEDLELASIYQHCKSPLIACMVLKGSNASASDIGSPFAFVTTLVNRETQQTYDDARGIELACLEELTADLDTDVCCKPHSPELEFRILWTRMYRARTEVLLLSQAIERANEFESSDGGSSRGGSIRALTPPLELECDDIASESSYGMKSISFSDVAFP
ncbi:hypothetical protein BJ138DRAFT_1164129 [Hygrophoropsis aurantiaca]|uniref:Uncharacterized protein n=1 Tax=Hygrophoropsis aurantiaca TaxID=72124 RepID=A0ACB7ZYH1_9AGAM|nr:hypothetical protein BJ138DRAFT_1164129 [Hygrophoropsis aurantiaca]